jgi:hypothetical protein
MPKMTDRERLAKIEADQQTLASEADTVRRALREHYGKLVSDLPAERLSERDFRDLVMQAVRVGGAVAVASLKALSPVSEGASSARSFPGREAPAKRRPVAGNAPDADHP